MLTPLAAPAQAREARADAPREIAYRQWDTAAELRTGTFSGATALGRQAPAGRPDGAHDDRPDDVRRGSWTSPWTRPGFALTELVPSWAATHPRGHPGPGRRARRQRGRHPQQLGHPRPLGARRRVLPPHQPGQPDRRPRPGRDRHLGRDLRRLQRPGSCGSPCSARPAPRSPRPSARSARSPPTCPRSTGSPRRGRVSRAGSCSTCRATPRWCTPASTPSTAAAARPGARRRRRRWCSPTTSKLPPSTEYAWVKKSYVDRVVDHAARMTFDHGYDGTGNWPFNTAYAARYDRARVRHPARVAARRRAVDRAGIPVVTSITFAPRRAVRRPDLGEQRPPRRGRRVHLGRRRGGQRPGVADPLRRPAYL